MNFIIWLVVGGILGWLASMLMKTKDQQGMILNVVVDVVGAILAGWFISPLVGIGTNNQKIFSLPAMCISFIGAAILLAIVNVFRRGMTRLNAIG
ncbi:MAG: GlsB/YeaQ/YmgE family stress response membrane protein [Candidatus Saccharibacteria bacterium]|nr:GlsB/YeaQ/YmgE family stress response membrane protein [Rhodoferax sp.]